MWLKNPEHIAVRWRGCHQHSPARTHAARKMNDIRLVEKLVEIVLPQIATAMESELPGQHITQYPTSTPSTAPISLDTCPWRTHLNLLDKHSWCLLPSNAIRNSTPALHTPNRIVCVVCAREHMDLINATWHRLHHPTSFPACTAAFFHAHFAHFRQHKFYASLGVVAVALRYLRATPIRVCCEPCAIA